jgi:hypothetical protein
MNNIGRKIIDNYCNGFFGREYNLSESIIIGEGHDWIVIKTIYDGNLFADFTNGNKQELIDSWCKE